MTRVELNRTRKYEGWLAHQFDQVLVTSPADKQALLQLSHRSEGMIEHAREVGLRRDVDSILHVLPNGVDLEYFSPGGGRRDDATITFTGKMSYHANVTAALHLVQDIMPHVWGQRPDVKVWIVGKDPTPAVRALASSSPNVLVTGTVPDVRPYLRQATMAVAPVPYGAGIQNKVLEAMACGTPVVASPQGVSALQTKPDRELLVADGAEAFAKAIISLLADPERRQMLGRAGRSYVEARHSWDCIGAQLEAVYQTAIAEKSVTA